MSLIQAIDIGMEFSSHYVLRGISCSVEHNSRIGLIGANGSGKSTLIKIMLGQLNPSEGTIVRAKKCKIAYLPQNMQLDPELVMEEYIRSSRADYVELNNAIAELSEELRLAANPQKERQLASLVDLRESSGALEHENRMKYVLNSLDFPIATWTKRIREFSGGEQTRICLAAMLLAPFDLLILDEPTNHLDIAMIRWLENYLSKLPQPYLLVSHDRRFLDNTVSNIYALREGGLTITKGNYSSYKIAADIAKAAAEKAAKEQEKWIARTEDFIARNMGSQKTAQARGRLKQLEKTQRVVVPKDHAKIKLDLKTQNRSGNVLYRCEDLSFGVGDRLLAQKLNLIAHYRDRLAIIGPNGCGKTTLIKMLLGAAEPLDGKLYRGASLDVAYYDQHQVSLDESLTVKESIWRLAPLEPVGYVLSWLARFGFRGDDVDKLVSVLSGGEKSRLYLAIIIHQKPNLLILDEPTNHLDIELTESLLTALQDFGGSVIFVSHDRWFIEQLATRYWVFRKNFVEGSQNQLYSTVEDIEGDLEELIRISFNPPELQKAKVDSRQRKRKQNPYYQQKAISDIEQKEAEIVQIEKQLEEIHLRLSLSETYLDPGLPGILQEQARELEAKIEISREDLGKLEEIYLDLACEE